MTRSVLCLLLLALSGRLVSSQPDGAAKEDPELAAYFKKKGWKSGEQANDGKLLLHLQVRNPAGTSEKIALTADDYKMIARSKAVQYLDLWEVKNTDAGLKILAGMPQLVVLLVSGDDVTDAGIEPFAKCRSLTRIHLATERVTDAGIKALGKLPGLRVLVLLGLRLNGSAFQAFAGSKSLECLWLELVKGFTDEGAKNLGKLPNLTDLRIRTASGEKTPTAAGIKAIADAHLPTTFEFDRNLIDDDLFESLVKNGWLYGRTPPGIGEKRPATAAEVRVINLGQTKVTDKGMRAILDCVNVEEFFLQNTGVGDETLQRLSGFKKLKYLALEKTRVTAKGLRAVAACPIEHLAVEQCELTEGAFEAMGKMTALEELLLSSTKMKAGWLKHIATLPKLKQISMTEADFDDDAVQYFLTIPSLEKLTLNDTKLGDAGFSRLLKLPKLESLHVDATRVTKDVYQKAKKDHPKVSLTHYAYDR